MVDPATGKTLVLATGTLTTGTAVASDVLSTPKYMETALSGAPKGWERKNVEIVVETKVVNNNQGVPNPIAVHVWKAYPR